MKKLILAAVASMAVATPAVAAGPTSVEIPISGTLAKRCSISAYLNGPFNALDMESTAAQGSESLTGNCNYGGSATVTFSSANAGSMVSGANSVPYKLRVTGTGTPADWSSTGKSLATPQQITGFPAVANANQTRGLAIILDNIATVAGTYADTITASIQPN
jgi:spore coat protein U-like protein